MCGRYNFTVEQSEEIKEILEKLNAKLQKVQVKTGEIYPTNFAPILIGEDDRVAPAAGSWGYLQYNKKGVIINARSETALEKKTFRGSLLTRRCIVPSTGFYEWDGKKRKYLFRPEGTNTLYMAGLYQYNQEELHYVILTTQANESLKDIHDRMPLVIPKNEIETWIMDSKVTNEILHRAGPVLRKEAVDGQLSLF